MTELENRIENLENISKKLLEKEKKSELIRGTIDQPRIRYPFLETLFVFLDHLDTYALLTDNKDRVIYTNKSLLKYVKSLGLNLDANNSLKWWKQLGWDHNPSNKKLITQECIDLRCVVEHKIDSKIKDNLKYNVICIPLKYNGVAAVLSIITKEQYDG